MDKGVIVRFTLVEVLKANSHTVKSTPEDVKANLKDLIARVNAIQFRPPMYCSSGYRSPKQNAAIGGAKRSAHMLGKAMDIRDPEGQLKQFLVKHEALLEELGLRMESPLDTGGLNGGWCHLDTMPVKYKRIFRA